MNRKISSRSWANPSHVSRLPGLTPGDQGTGDAMIVNVPREAFRVRFNHFICAGPSMLGRAARAR